MTPTTTPGACVREVASPFSAVGGAGTVSSRAPVPAAPVSISWDQAVRGLPGAGGRVPRVTSFVVAPQTPESPAIRTGATEPFGCSSPQARASVAESLASKPLPVRHAGMVLLWPFLCEWLTTQGLMAEGEFTDRAARIQAARQLCWLIGEDLGSEPGQTERPPSLLLALRPAAGAAPRTRAATGRGGPDAVPALAAQRDSTQPRIESAWRPRVLRAFSAPWRVSAAQGGAVPGAG